MKINWLNIIFTSPIWVFLKRVFVQIIKPVRVVYDILLNVYEKQNLVFYS